VRGPARHGPGPRAYTLHVSAGLHHLRVCGPPRLARGAVRRRAVVGEVGELGIVVVD